MGRPLGILFVGLAIAIGVGVAIVPLEAAGLGFVLMIGVVIVGVVITIIAGFRGKKADEARELARQSRLLVRDSGPKTHPE